MVRSPASTADPLPFLPLFLVWLGLASSGRYAEAESMLEAAEHLLDTIKAAPAGQRSAVAATAVGRGSELTESETRGEIAGLRAYLALRHADFARSILLGRESLEQMSQVSPRRGLIAWTATPHFVSSREMPRPPISRLPIRPTTERTPNAISTSSSLERLRELEAEGVIGQVADEHFGFGFCRSAKALLAPGREVARRLAHAHIDLVLLVPA